MKCMEISVMCFHADNFSEITCNLLICVSPVYMCTCTMYLYSIYTNTPRSSTNTLMKTVTVDLYIIYPSVEDRNEVSKK